VLSVRLGFRNLMPIAAWLSTTTLGILLFGWMLRRPLRDDGSPRAGVLSMVAAAGAGVWRDAPDRSERGASADPESPTDGSGTASEDASPVPALTLARPTGWQSRPALEFDVPPKRDTVRRRITYRLVRMSDGPDDLRSREIMRLDRGDEIEILGQEGNYLQVRTPTGEVGWIPSLSIIG
jgi:hypothetical protein